MANNKFFQVIFANRGDAAASMNSNVSGITYPKGIRWVAFSGIMFGVAACWYYLNHMWLHFPGPSMVFFAAAVALWWLCFLMMTIGVRSIASNTMWIGIALTVCSVLFMCFHWPGGTAMGLYGFTYLYVILLAIGYLKHLPQEYLWVKHPLGWWLIAPQVCWIIIYWVRWFKQREIFAGYDFEPAIPYADHTAMSEMFSFFDTQLILAYGLSVLPFSIWLYVVAKRQCKKFNIQ